MNDQYTAIIFKYIIAYIDVGLCIQYNTQLIMYTIKD